LVTSKLLLLIFWIVPIETVGHFVVVGVVAVEVLELALLLLPQAVSSTANITTGITVNNFLIMCLL